MKKIKWMFLIPLVYLILLSLFTYFKYPNLLPSRLSLEYWQNILGQNRFISALFNTFIIGSSTSILASLLGFMNGRYIVKYLGGYSKKVALLISLPLLIPGMILFLGVHQVLIVLRLSNTYMGIILVHTLICLPYTSNIAIAYFTGISNEYEQISSILGASGMSTFRQILLPLLMPGILTSMMISFLISNTEYFSTFLLGGGQVITLSMIMFPYINQGDYGHASVMGLIFLGLHITLFFLLDLYHRGQNGLFYGG